MTEWERKELIEKKTAHWDDEPGGAGQAARLRDSVRSVMRKLVTPKPSLQDRIDARRAETPKTETGEGMIGMGGAVPSDTIVRTTPPKKMTGLGGAAYGELASSSAQPTVTEIPKRQAAKMEAQVKLPAEYALEKLDNQFSIFEKEIGDALSTGGQFLPKELRPKVAKGMPSEVGTVTSKAINQYFTSKLKTLMDEMNRVQSEMSGQASIEQVEYYNLVRDRAKHVFRQVQELRRTSHESLAFWNQIRAELLNIQQSLGFIGPVRRAIPILDQFAKDVRAKQYQRAARDLLEYARVNLFTLGSWTLDFFTNAIVGATKQPAFVAGDVVSLIRGKPAFQTLGSIQALKKSSQNLVPFKNRYRLPEQIEIGLGTTAGSEFQGLGKEVMVDFSEILKGKPELAQKLKGVDVVLSAPVRMKRATDGFFGRLGAASELYQKAYSQGRNNGLKGDNLQTFVKNYVENPPQEAIAEAIRVGKEWKFNRDLPNWAESFSRSSIVKLALEAFPRWTFQFAKWGGEMIGINPRLYRRIKSGEATQAEVIDGLTKAATGWGGIYLFNQIVYDNIDANTMEYIREDGDRVRLSGRTPFPELFLVTAIMRGDFDKAKMALPQTSIPLAKLLGGEPGGIISPVVDVMRESMRGRYTAERTANELVKVMNNAIPGKSVLAFVRSLYDPTVREGLGAPVPGVSSLLPTRINPTTGEPLAPMQKIPGTSFKFPTVGGTPFPGAVRDLNSIEAVLLNHGIGTFRPRRISLIELPAEDVPSDLRREYEKIAGSNVKRILGEGITNPMFWKYPSEIRTKVLQGWLSSARLQARLDLANKYQKRSKQILSEPTRREVIPERIKSIRPME